MGDWFDTHALVPFKPCSSFILVGPSGSGKTLFIRRFLQDLDGFYNDNPPLEILYCYDIHQKIFDTMNKEIENIVFMEGLPSPDQIDSFLKDDRHRMLILDDLQYLIKDSKHIEKLFTAGSHHRSLSVLFVSQNIFQQGTSSRTISLNSFYQILFPSTRDRGQIATLGRQMYWKKSNSFLKIYEDVLHNDYGYLIVDNSPGSNDTYRLRTCIFPGEDTIVYQIE